MTCFQVAFIGALYRTDEIVDAETFALHLGHGSFPSRRSVRILGANIPQSWVRLGTKGNAATGPGRSCFKQYPTPRRHPVFPCTGIGKPGRAVSAPTHTVLFLFDDSVAARHRSLLSAQNDTESARFSKQARERYAHS